MRKFAALVISFALGTWGITAAAQGHSQGHSHGRPTTTGIEHAEATANAQGERGIENLESKQAAHRDSDKDTAKNHGKHKAKGKSKKD